jgi:hypothetical protein
MIIEEILKQFRKIRHEYYQNNFLCRDKLSSFKIRFSATFFIIFLFSFIYFFPGEGLNQNPYNILWQSALSLLLTFVLRYLFRKHINRMITKKYTEFGVRLDHFELKKTLEKILEEKEQQLLTYLNYIINNSTEFNENNALARNESAIQSIETVEQAFFDFVKIFKELYPDKTRKLAKDIKKTWEKKPIYSEDENIIKILSNYHLLSTFIKDEKATEINEFQKKMKTNSYKITKEFPDIPEGYIDFSIKRDFEIATRKKTLIDLLEK